ncbi:hypothetical protein GCM10023318_48120 [Nocardia callitridis]|uniref:Nudix hydrolase domain-containing protein n=1 Tax=Nocardia callitridis TaxID=648753 RepID=A0ABP9KTR5_9NOCA
MLEQRHIAQTLDWLRGTDDIFRRVKPATPSPHLVSYVALIDPHARAIFLGRHRKASLWLPMGGHLEPGERPLDAARREAVEEIAIEPQFTVVGEEPLFLTVTTTRGPAAHVDISFWHVISGNSALEYALDPAEFDGGHWWDFDKSTLPDSDPHLARFLTKLGDALP